MKAIGDRWIHFGIYEAVHMLEDTKGIRKCAPMSHCIISSLWAFGLVDYGLFVEIKVRWSFNPMDFNNLQKLVYFIYESVKKSKGGKKGVESLKFSTDFYWNNYVIGIPTAFIEWFLLPSLWASLHFVWLCKFRRNQKNYSTPHRK